MIFNVPMHERTFFKVYGGGIAERIYSTVFVETEDDSWVRLWGLLVTVARMTSEDTDRPDLLNSYQRAAIGLTLALNDQ